MWVGIWRIVWEEGDGLKGLFWGIVRRECRSFGCSGLVFVCRLDAGGDGWVGLCTDPKTLPCGNRVSSPPR